MKPDKNNPGRSVFCDYCREPCHLVTDVELYGRSYGGAMFWKCDPCGAWVGCHRNSRDFLPIGRLANSELRTAKIAAHTAFDPLWRHKMNVGKMSKNRARKEAYGWLSLKMGVDPKLCHIGMFDVPHCKRVVEICLPVATALLLEETDQRQRTA